MCRVLRSYCNNATKDVFNHPQSIAFLCCESKRQTGICSKAQELLIYAPVCGSLCFQCVYDIYEKTLQKSKSPEVSHMVHKVQGTKDNTDDEFGDLYTIYDRICKLVIAKKIAQSATEIWRGEPEGVILAPIWVKNVDEFQGTSLKFASRNQLAKFMRASPYLERREEFESAVERAFLVCISKFLSYKTRIKELVTNGGDLQFERYSSILTKVLAQESLDTEDSQIENLLSSFLDPNSMLSKNTKSLPENERAEL